MEVSETINKIQKDIQEFLKEFKYEVSDDKFTNFIEYSLHEYLKERLRDYNLKVWTDDNGRPRVNIDFPISMDFIVSGK